MAWKQTITVLETVLISVLFGCAHPPDAPSGSADADVLERNVRSALPQHPATARAQIAEALRGQPQNGYLHLLNGLTYQLEPGSLQSSALAKVGYDAAVKFAPNHYWAHYLDGSVALESSNYPEAAEHFSSAIIDDPSRPQAFLGLAVAAYFARDLPLARAASERALSLAPENPWAWRTAAYILAAEGEQEKLDALLTRANTVPAAAQIIQPHKPRLSQLVRTAALVELQQDDNPYKPVQPQPWMIPRSSQSGTSGFSNSPAPFASGAAPGASPSGINQVMVEVTLLLNQSEAQNSTGINLLDGLAVQFGSGYTTTDTRNTGAAHTFQRVLTTDIHIPQVTYSLNLFNTREDYYRVLARPSLVAYLNQPSEFFIGRTVTIGVSGINIGTLQPIDVGISVKVLPSEITAEKTRFNIQVQRSFVTDNVAGTFQQALTTFKQIVSATAEVDFGQTLVLSGLYEGVDVGALSKTPGLGDVPGADVLFNARTQTQRRDVALVLVTPRLVGSIQTNEPEFRGDSLKRLLSVWTELVDPTCNMDAIFSAIGERHRRSNLFRPKPGDVRVPPVSDAPTLNAVIAETVAQLR